MRSNSSPSTPDPQPLPAPSSPSLGQRAPSCPRSRLCYLARCDRCCPRKLTWAALMGTPAAALPHQCQVDSTPMAPCIGGSSRKTARRPRSTQAVGSPWMKPTWRALPFWRYRARLLHGTERACRHRSRTPHSCAERLDAALWWALSLLSRTAQSIGCPPAPKMSA
jgi:hypothetical protein